MNGSEPTSAHPSIAELWLRPAPCHERTFLVHKFNSRNATMERTIPCDWITAALVGIRQQTPPDLNHAVQGLDTITRDEPIAGSISAIAEATFVLATLLGRTRDGLLRSTIPQVVETCCQERSSAVSDRFSRTIQPVSPGRLGPVPRSGVPDPRRGRNKMLLRPSPVRCQGRAT